MNVLRGLIDSQDDEARETGQPLLALTPNAHKKAYYERVLPRSGVQDFHFHDLRHESISRLAESGRFQLIELQAISGHRDMRMLQRYAHLCSGQLAQKMDELGLGTTTRYVHRGRKRTATKIEHVEGCELMGLNDQRNLVRWAEGPDAVEESSASRSSALVSAEISERRESNVIDFTKYSSGAKRV